MRFLIAGLGSIGRRHLRNLVALGERDLVLYRTRTSALPEQELTGFPIETDLQAALERKPDAVVISNPTAMHLPIAIQAALAGCHILLEKPIADALDLVEEFRNAVDRSQVSVLVGYQFRFHPTLRIASRLISEGAIGKPISVRAHWGEYLPGWHPWEDHRTSYAARSDLGGGVILTLSHSLDYVRWLFGQVRSVSALSGTDRDLDIAVDSVAEIALQFTNGALGSVHLDYLQRPPTHTMNIVGSAGTMRWDNQDGVLHLYQVKDEKWVTWGPPGGFDRNDMFLDEMKHFVEVCKRNAEPICRLEDGVRVLEIALLAQQGAKDGMRRSLQ